MTFAQINAQDFAQRKRETAGRGCCTVATPQMRRALWDELADKWMRGGKSDPQRHSLEDALLPSSEWVLWRDQDSELNVLFHAGFHRIPSQQERN